MPPPNYTWAPENGMTDLCREEAAWATSHLVYYFGIKYVKQASISVNKAVFAATQHWAIDGPPADTTAWIVKRSTDNMVSAIRNAYINETVLQLTHSMELEDSVLPVNSYLLNRELAEMLFLCCHPTLTEEESNVLCLRVLCNLTNCQAACAMLLEEKDAATLYNAAIRKASNIGKPEIPIELFLEEHLNVLLDRIYLIFNEGYSLTCCDQQFNDRLCLEAIRLATSLVTVPETDRSEVHALLALMYFNQARSASRLNEKGEFLMLHHQDRKRWDKTCINRGWQHFRKGTYSKHPTTFHLEAGIAAQHIVSKKFEDTDWEIVLGYYDSLLCIKPAPDIFLNRLLVYGYINGDEAALIELDAEVENYMDKNHLYYLVRSELQERIGIPEDAIASLEQAIQLVQTTSEKEIITKKLIKIKA